MKRLLAVENNNKENHNIMESIHLYDNGANTYMRKQPDRLMASFNQNTSLQKFKKKQIIYTEGNHPSQLFYIKKGIVKTFKCNSEGKELITGIYGEGEFLGYVALLEETVYRDIAVAVEYAELAVIPKDEFELLMETDWQIARQFINMLARDISEKEKLLLGLAYNSLRKKVAEALILLSKKYKDAIKISRDNLAAIAGTATESLIRTLGEFRQEKLIDISEGYITIVNEAKLKTMLN
ncbi:Crp/Fnr family transcriptional regulator [Niastella populi]|nr:Crp/Fnr family transcriptional regulator [Niastella populi]